MTTNEIMAIVKPLLSEDGAVYQGLLAAVEAMAAELEAAKAQALALHMVMAERELCKQELEAAKRDAAKYHALRDSGYLMPVEFDAAVTKAMFAQEVK